MESLLTLPELNAEHEIYQEHLNSVDAIAVNPANPNEFASGSHDKTLKLWDVQKAKCKATYGGNKQGIWSLHYEPKGKLLVSASPEGVCKIWDAKSGKATHTMEAHLPKRAYWCRFNEGGNYFASCGSDRLVKLWDMKKLKEPLKLFKGHAGVVSSCDFMGKDKLILSTSLDGDIIIFDIEKGLVLEHSELSEKQRSNIIYCGRAIRSD